MSRRLLTLLVAPLIFFGAGALAPSVALGAACDEIVANGFGARQASATHGYMVNNLTFEADDRANEVLLSIIDSHRSWNDELTDCWHLRNTAVEHRGEFAGLTALRANARNADFTNVVDFGTFGGQPEWGECSHGGRLACAVFFTNPVRPNQIVDSDIRFDVWWDWYDGRFNNGDAFNETGIHCGQYDLWGVGAHEVGHTLGFNHVAGLEQTMYASTGACEIKKRTLGAADLYGYRSYYRNPAW